MFTFTTDTSTCGPSEILIAGVSGDILQQLIDYCYTNEIEINESNVEEITEAAVRLQFSDVEEECVELFSSILSASNCFGIRAIADQHNMRWLKGLARDLIQEQFMKVSMCDEYHQLSVDMLSEVLKDDLIDVKTEENVFEALMRWVQYDADNRKHLVASLLECVRFQHVKVSVSTN